MLSGKDFRRQPGPHSRFTQQLDFRVDFQMQVGNPQQKVEVSATPPLLETENASLAVTVDSKKLVELPSLGGRLFQR
jgi:hypothetical protein